MDSSMNIAFDAPIPGQSLTSSPDKRFPYEKPPQYTTLEQCLKFIFKQTTDKDNFEEILNLIRNGTTLEELAETIAFTGFSDGFWTVHMRMLLLEPIIYMLYFLSTQAGIDPVIYEGEDEDLEPEEEVEELKKKPPSKVPGLMDKGGM
jgi:hypothetical protein